MERTPTWSCGFDDVALGQREKSMAGVTIERLDVIATTISGSVRDWGKISRLEPLFSRYFPGRVRAHIVDSHEAAREAAETAVREGSRMIVSAGGAGTFNRVMQGVLDGTDDLSKVRLGFLRKGSADLIGKALHIPDVVEEAVRVIAEGMLKDRVISCDVINAREQDGQSRNFVGFGGLEVIGDIPYFTDNPWTKYYKGILGWLFGDLGPFRVGTSLALATWLLRKCLGRAHRFRLEVDGMPLGGERYLSILLVNGDLGPDMPFGRGYGLDRGEFYLIALRDMGFARMAGQLRGSFSGRVAKDPARWGFEMRPVRKELKVFPLMKPARRYRVNIDGLKWDSKSPLTFKTAGKIRLISGR